MLITFDFNIFLMQYIYNIIYLCNVFTIAKGGRSTYKTRGLFPLSVSIMA
jgi:hypothetical protein